MSPMRPITGHGILTPALRAFIGARTRPEIDTEAMISPAEAREHGVSIAATGRALARAWHRTYGADGAREVIDAMLDEVRRAEEDRRSTFAARMATAKGE